MARLSFSGREQSIESIWGWYRDQRTALRDFRMKIISAVRESGEMADPKFMLLSLDELNQYFNDSEQELEHLVSFSLISAVEARLRIDYLNRVYGRDRSVLGRAFREIYKVRGERVSLEDDIIAQWKKFSVGGRKWFSEFLGLLRYRHWLAHGRYWQPKLGRDFSPYSTYEIAENLLRVI